MSKRLIPHVTWRSHEHKHHGVGDAAVAVLQLHGVHGEARLVLGQLGAQLVRGQVLEDLGGNSIDFKNTFRPLF